LLEPIQLRGIFTIIKHCTENCESNPKSLGARPLSSSVCVNGVALPAAGQLEKKNDRDPFDRSTMFRLSYAEPICPLDRSLGQSLGRALGAPGLDQKAS
jgi:hypothetical protein